MSTQIELLAPVSDQLAERLETSFFEAGLVPWGIMRRAPDTPCELFGYFDDEKTAQRALADLRTMFPDLPENFQKTTLKDSDWQNAYKHFVQPWHDRVLHWIPRWEKDAYSLPDGAVPVYLDAGMAFGTGSHETTRLCARRLLDYREAHCDHFEHLEIIDAGCGSGVLALSAAALGFRKIHAFDFDPDAIPVCRDNAEANPHIPAVEWLVADLENGLAGKRADLLLANIQTDVLMPHADPLVDAIKPGGCLALSGILARELDQVRAHYEERFATRRGKVPLTSDSRTDGEWADLLIQSAVPVA
ncbi:MAG: 50S ribosomal protein L11 methyltransferase [Opitutales bacterium]